VRGLPSRKKNLEARMRRASLSMIVYLIWEERNKRIFEGKSTLPDLVFRKFQILFFMVLHFHEKNHTHINVAGDLSFGCDDSVVAIMAVVVVLLLWLL
jgi:hypothetical protein